MRRRLETAGSTELQEGLLGRWVESARDKVHVVAKAGPHHHHRNTILEAEEDGNDCEPIICVVHLPSSADTASLEPGRCPGPAQAAPEPLARLAKNAAPDESLRSKLLHQIS